MSEFEKIDAQTFIDAIRFDEKGLVPAIIQDESDGSILMVGFMNRTSLEMTLEKKKVTFWSRSRQTLWTKGETSGNFLELCEIFTDCDFDTILVKARPCGPTCHTGERSCFFRKLE